MISMVDLNRNLLYAAIASVCLSLATLSNVYANEGKLSAQRSTSGQALFAKVGDREITLDQYRQHYNRAIRERFYHSKPPEAELDAVRKEIGDELIIRELLLLEAGRLGLQADAKTVQATLEQYDRRYAESSRWQEQRASLLGTLKVKLEEDDLLRQVESRIRNIPAPTEKQIRDYYQQNPDKFTEPMQQKLSLILLVVDPSSSKDVWQAALDKGRELVEELRNDADFAEYARSYSGDVSAENGGDMGYVHREMLSESVQIAIDKLQPGQMSDAIRTLQGIAILRLDDRKPKRLKELSDVNERARKLWLREHSDAAWSGFKAKLRVDTPVTVFINVADSDNDV